MKAPKLKSGDTIMMIAPSSSMAKIEKERIAKGQKKLENLGFKIKIHPYCTKIHGHTAGTAKERAEMIMDAFLDKEVQGIMAVFGGFNSSDTIEYLDYELIKKNPKPFIGYSDITILNTVLYTQANLVNFQGPAFVSFMHPSKLDYETQIFKDVFIEGKTPYTIKASKEWVDCNDWYKPPFPEPDKLENKGWQTYQSGVAEGTLIGGNIGTLLALAGTKYFPDFKDKILFIEDDDVESPNSINRYLRQLRHLGVYEKINGLIIGRFPSSVGFKEGDSLNMILDEVLEGYKLPVVTEVDIGHTRPLITLPIGTNVKLDADKQELVYLEKPFIE